MLVGPSFASTPKDRRKSGFNREITRKTRNLEQPETLNLISLPFKFRVFSRDFAVTLPGRQALHGKLILFKFRSFRCSAFRRQGNREIDHQTGQGLSGYSHSRQVKARIPDSTGD
jgi:hypothetical protein